MYMRIVRAQPPQDQADEVARRWTAFWPEKLRTQPGFRHAHFGIDRATGAITGVTVFDERPDDALFERLSGEFRAILEDIASAQMPNITVYEIAAEA